MRRSSVNLQGKLSTMTRALSEWVKVIAYQLEDGACTLSAICKDLEAAPIVKSGGQLPDLPPGEYKILPWRLDV